MGKFPDGRLRLRLEHAELVPREDDRAFTGMLWDAYLEAAARMIPDVLESLTTTYAMEPEDYLSERGYRQTLTPGALRIKAWCQHWGFNEEYTFHPALNTLILTKRAQEKGESLPDMFVSTWSGQLHPRWQHEDSGPTMEVFLVKSLPNGQPDWNLHGKPHPFSELPGRLIGHGHFIASGGNGVRPIQPRWAQHQGTQVDVKWPIVFWDPTAETRHEARQRILAVICELLDGDLETIVNAYLDNGYQRPLEKRTTIQFEWLVRYQLLGETKRHIARTDHADPSNVMRQVNDVAALIGLELNPPKLGRPRKHRPTRKQTRTVKVLR